MKIISLLSPIIKGVLKSTPGANVVVNALESRKIESENSPKGKIDWIEMVVGIVFLATVIAYIFGKIDEGQVKFINDKSLKVLITK